MILSYSFNQEDADFKLYKPEPVLQVYCQNQFRTFTLVLPADLIQIGTRCYLEIYYQFGTFDGKLNYTNFIFVVIVFVRLNNK